MKTSLFPIGTIVSLYQSNEKLMITGYFQKNYVDSKIWDYVGLIYPTGYLSANRMVLFDHNQIETMIFRGCQDTEQLQFEKQLEILLEETGAMRGELL